MRTHKKTQTALLLTLALAGSLLADPPKKKWDLEIKQADPNATPTVTKTAPSPSPTLPPKVIKGVSAQEGWQPAKENAPAPAAAAAKPTPPPKVINGVSAKEGWQPVKQEEAEKKAAEQVAPKPKQLQGLSSTEGWHPAPSPTPRDKALGDAVQEDPNWASSDFVQRQITEINRRLDALEKKKTP